MVVLPIYSDLDCNFLWTPFGIKVIPHPPDWLGYYRLDLQEEYHDHTLILTGYPKNSGNPPGELTISQVAFEKIRNFLFPKFAYRCGYCGEKHFHTQGCSSNEKVEVLS